MGLCGEQLLVLRTRLARPLLSQRDVGQWVPAPGMLRSPGGCSAALLALLSASYVVLSSSRLRSVPQFPLSGLVPVGWAPPRHPTGTERLQAAQNAWNDFSPQHRYFPSAGAFQISRG